MLALAAAFESNAGSPALRGSRNGIRLQPMGRSCQLADSSLRGVPAWTPLSRLAIDVFDRDISPLVHAEGHRSGRLHPVITGCRCSASLAKRGFTGPKGLFEGPYGLEQMFAQSIPVDWEDPSLDIVKQTIMKKYCSLIHGQPVLEAVLDLKRRNSLTADEVEHVRCNVFKPAFDFRRGR